MFFQGLRDIVLAHLLSLVINMFFSYELSARIQMEFGDLRGRKRRGSVRESHIMLSGH